jgi:electron transport complex protein RnfG
VAFKTSDQGYSSVIEVMSGMLIDGTVTAIKVLSHNETPGLGSKVAEKEFAIQFKGAKNLDNVQAVTGATISSRAIIDSVKKRIEKIKELLKG